MYEQAVISIELSPPQLAMICKANVGPPKLNLSVREDVGRACSHGLDTQDTRYLIRVFRARRDDILDEINDLPWGLMHEVVDELCKFE